MVKNYIINDGVIGIMKRRGRTAAQKRFDQKYPPLTIRLDRSLREVLDQLKKEGQTYQEIVFNILSDKLEPAKALAEELAQAREILDREVVMPDGKRISTREYIEILFNRKSNP